ncbi:unnamed protein product [Owenia fusiformis]|uniref:Large ribosomal subunit protein mL37 n=1 Tax=Owenia fusiformis TaxID=6347 RepID=A0A8S4PTR6_OWEFU|nr:unnamed protein product [Owenia fusiformis]
MRLTISLQRTSMTWLKKQLWKVKKNYKVENVIPMAVYEKGINFENPTPNKTKTKRVPIHIPPPLSNPRKTLKEQKYYNEEPMLTFNQSTKMMEGLKQACILTKTMPIEGLPDSVHDLIGKESIPYQDELVQRAIMQANVWHTDMDKMPKRINKQKPGWRFKAEWGIKLENRSSMLVWDLLRICGVLGGKYSDLTLRRLTKNQLTGCIHTFENRQINISNASEAQVWAPRPLPQAMNTEDVDSTVTHQLPDIFPVSPFIDLPLVHLYENKTHTGWSNPKADSRFPHTMYITDNKWAKPEHKDARALMFLFAQAVAHSKEKYGMNIRQLPEPITNQCVYTDGAKFNFVTFQLNTLDTSNPDGIKNVVWIDRDNELYDRQLPFTQMMTRRTKYLDYDSAIFQKFLAMYLSGAVLTQ